MPGIATSDGIQISYQLEGDSSKPTLAFSNSLGTNRSMWDKQALTFADSFQILRYDTRGHGQSDAPEGPYSLERLGNDVVDLLDALELDSVHFCGLSLGGMTGMWLGSQSAERIQSLTLCCTSAFLPPADLWNLRIQQVADHGMASITEVVLNRWFTPPFLATESADQTSVREQLQSTPIKGYTGCCGAIRDMDCRPSLPSINKPCLIIAGADDQATPPEHGKLIAAGIPGASYLEIEDAAHLSNIEQAETFNSTVLNFLLQHSQ
ncbi:3-oxoadipate enol-lactonase [Opitutia bacterium ISCC 51]|nr:3-oxoadipate enol-lactonase [Opitutae bacterium ISCC 51]QXD29763.1 3-oxoadipate enol-lactonase [Opitutae bacterium ISCC 52]